MKKIGFSILWAICAFSFAHAQTDPGTPTPPPTPPMPAGESGQMINIRPGSTLVISGLTTICKGGESTLKVEGDYESFLWNTGGTDRFLRIKEAGVYEVTAKTKGGCMLTGSVNVEVVSCL